MIETSLTVATAIYSCRSTLQIERHPIAHPAFREFSFKLRNFEGALGDEIENEYWKPFVRRLKRYRFEVTAAPLDFGNPVLMSTELMKRLQGHIAHLTMQFPRFA